MDELPPPSVGPALDFTIYWIRTDINATLYEGITGSQMQGDLLLLYRDQFMATINMRAVTAVESRPS